MSKQYYRDKWDEIHRNAAKTQRGLLSHGEFCYWMRSIPGQLPCSTCRNHAESYIASYPPEYADNLFIWSWTFHNAVNARLGKDFYDYSRAAREYRV